MQKLAEICIRRPVFATMIVLTLVVVGTVGYLHLGADRFPSVDLPVVRINARLTGAAIFVPEGRNANSRGCKPTVSRPQICSALSGLNIFANRQPQVAPAATHVGPLRGRPNLLHAKAR